MRFILFLAISFFSISVYSQALPVPKQPYPFDQSVPNNLMKVQLRKYYNVAANADDITGKITNRPELITNAQKISNASRTYLRALGSSMASFLGVLNAAELLDIYLDSQKTLKISAKPSDLFDLTGTALGTIPIEDLPESPSDWLDIAIDLYPNQEKFYKVRSSSGYRIRLARSLTTPCGGEGQPTCSSRNFPKYWNDSFTESYNAAPSGDVDYWGEQYSRVIDGARQQIFSFVKRTGELQAPAIVYNDITEEQTIGAIPETSLANHLDVALIADLVNQIYEGAKVQDSTLPDLEPVTAQDVREWLDLQQELDPAFQPLTVRDLLRHLLNELGELPAFDPEPYIDDLIQRQEQGSFPSDFEWMCGIDGTPDCAVSVDDSGFSDVDDPLSDADSLLDAYVDDVLTGLPECIGDDCDESNPWGFSMSPFMPDFSPFVGACQNPDISIFGTFLDIDLCGLAADVKPLLNFLFYFFILFNFRRLFLAISSN